MRKTPRGRREGAKERATAHVETSLAYHLNATAPPHQPPHVARGRSFLLARVGRERRCDAVVDDCITAEPEISLRSRPLIRLCCSPAASQPAALPLSRFSATFTTSIVFQFIIPQICGGARGTSPTLRPGDSLSNLRAGSDAGQGTSIHPTFWPPPPPPPPSLVCIVSLSLHRRRLTVRTASMVFTMIPPSVESARSPRMSQPMRTSKASVWRTSLM